MSYSWTFAALSRVAKVCRRSWKWKFPDLEKKLNDWQIYYNEFRPHGSLHGQTPWERWGELSLKTPFTDEVEALYDPSKERIQDQNYRADLELRKVKASV